MSPRISSAAAPGSAPALPPQPVLPEKLAPKPFGPKRRRWPLGLLILFLLAGLAYVAALFRPAATPASPEAVAVPTARVAVASLEKTIRLNGTTAALNYAMMLTPTLRGGFHGHTNLNIGSVSTAASRSSGRPSTTSAAAASSSGDSSGGSSTQASQASASPTGGASSSSGSTASSGAQGSALSGPTSSSSAFRAATSRFSTPGSTSAGASRSSGGSASTGSGTGGTMGGRGLGSTGESLPGGSQGPPSVGSASGGSAFSLVLEGLAKPGSRVKKGEMVAAFDDENMLIRLDDFKASVVQAETSIRRFQAELEVVRKAHAHEINVARAELDKARLDLKTIPVRSAIATELLQLAAEEAEARYQQLQKEVQSMENSLKSQVRLAELTRDQARLEARRVEADVAKLTLRAPLDGLVVMQTIWRGGEMAQVQQGDQLYPGQPFAQVVDPDSMVINATVNQVNAELIRIGAKARVRFDAYPELELPARVYAVGAMTKSAGWRASYVKEIPVSLRLERTDPRVIPDLSVGVDVVLDTAEKAVIVPLESLFRDGPDSKPYVFLQASAGWERREVEPGLATSVAAEIRSGVAEGDVIALAMPRQSPDGR